MAFVIQTPGPRFVEEVLKLYAAWRALSNETLVTEPAEIRFGEDILSPDVAGGGWKPTKNSPRLNITLNIWEWLAC
jgi:hypothetical protein